MMILKSNKKVKEGKFVLKSLGNFRLYRKKVHDVLKKNKGGYCKHIKILVIIYMYNNYIYVSN